VPGDPLLLTFYWQKEGAPVPAMLPLALLDEEGTAVLQWPLPLTRADFDLAQWQRGERLRSQHALRLPASLGNGTYQLSLDGVSLGVLQIEAPERVFEMPPLETAVVVPFTAPDTQHLATLVGYNLAIEETAVVLSLVWQAHAEIPTSYRVFVHLVNQNGELRTQSDGEPANWSRPTTGWANGEYITDNHQLTLHADQPLTLRVGLYDPATGQRLQTPTGDFVAIPLP
jgi:hypothetical protein